MKKKKKERKKKHGCSNLSVDFICEKYFYYPESEAGSDGWRLLFVADRALHW